MADRSSSSESADEDGMPELLIDPRFPGRVALLNDNIGDDEANDARFGFGSFPRALEHAGCPALIADCRRAFTASATDEGEESAERLGVSSGDTYWVGVATASDGSSSSSSSSSSSGGGGGGTEATRPRCALEALALEVFRFHTERLGLQAGVHYRPEISGAEWWTQCIDNRDGEIGFHWDKDYSLEEGMGLDVFPLLATVTYLSEKKGAAPTIVFDHCATPLGSNGGGDEEEEEEEEKEEEQEGESRQSPYATDEQGIRRAWLSSPALGKHICFNGRHLHGAAGVLASAFDGTSTTSTTTGAAANAANEDEDDDDEEEEEESNEPPKKKQRGNEDDDESDGAEEGLRVTFLVNIWLNWKPLGAESLSDKIAAAMEATHSDVDGGSPTASSATASVSFGRPARAQCAPLVWSEGKHKGSTPRRLVRLFEQRGRPHKLSVPLPNEMPHDDEEEEEDEDEDEDEESEEESPAPRAKKGGRKAPPRGAPAWD